MSTVPTRDRWLLLLDEPPIGAMYRVAVGYLIIPTYWHFAGMDEPTWGLLLFFMAVLISLRIGPLLVRKALPFSDEVVRVWKERRMVAKRFDSYQWAKLVWFGLGMSLYLGSAERAPRWGVALAVFCVVAGGIGLLIWQRRRRTANPV